MRKIKGGGEGGGKACMARCVGVHPLCGVSSLQWLSPARIKQTLHRSLSPGKSQRL